MHLAPLQFVESVLSASRPGGPISILEVGSYDVNGSIREVVRRSPMNAGIKEYVGVDLMQGPGVDMIVSGHEVAIEDSHFDLVMSLECFEHNPYWQDTLRNMLRMLKPGGWCIVTCASLGRPEHGTSRMDAASSPGTSEKGWSYYQNVSLQDFRNAVPFAETFDHCTLEYGAAWNDLYFVGRKRGNGANIGETGDFRAIWDAAARGNETPSLKRRATYLMEAVLGSRLFQSFYVTIWRAVKPMRR